MKHIFTFTQFLKKVTFFGKDYCKPFTTIDNFIDDFGRIYNSRAKRKTDKKLRNYFTFAFKGQFIKLSKELPVDYSKVIELTEFGSRYLVDKHDKTCISLWSGAIGAISAAVITLLATLL